MAATAVSLQFVTDSIAFVTSYSSELAKRLQISAC